MFRPTPAHTPKVKNPAHAAQAMANSCDQAPGAKFCCPPAGAAAIDMLWDSARFDGRGLAADVAPPAQPPRPGVTPAIAIEDWDILLCAVKARLRLSVDERLAAVAETPVQDTAGRVRASVLECVEALDQLHTTQKHELSRRQRLQLEVFDARTALAQARAELAGTQVQERRARHLAQHDSLTSLPNRNFFGERLNHALAHAEPQHQPIAVLYLDLDGFKPINDTYGHATGDELLRIVAARLTQTLRVEDMVSRLGGDEFACLLGGLPRQEQLSHLACKLFDAVSAPVKIGPLNLTVRPSIGIAMCPADGATAEALLKNADAAMYRAKRQQTGYAFFEEYTDVWAHETESLSNS